MITVTDSAKDKIKDILAEENDPNLKLRMFVQGGGCAGFSYGLNDAGALAQSNVGISLSENVNVFSQLS